MSKYLETKKDSLEDMVSKVSEGKQTEDYKQLFKKELEKAGKGVGAMSDQEKKAFFNNIDKKHKAKNEEGSKEIQIKNKRITPGEGTGAAFLDNPRRMKEEKELDEFTTISGKGIKYDNDKKGWFDDKDKRVYLGKSDTNKLMHKDIQKKMKTGDWVTKFDLSKEENEVEEGRVKDILIDIESDAGDMSLNDLIKKYYNQMGLSAQDIKKIYYRVNEEFDINEKYVAKFTDGGPDIEVPIGTKSAHDISKLLKKVAPTRYPKYIDKFVKVEEKDLAVKEEVKGKDLPDSSNSLVEAVQSVWNMAAEEQEKREKEAVYYKTDKKENKKDKDKKAMTGSKVTKVDTEPEVDFDSK
jgi:hypothetical protein